MRRFTQWAARTFAPGYENPSNIEARTKVGLLEGWVSIAGNTVMAALKGVLGYLTGSVSLIADAAHTFADSGTSVIVIMGFKAARRPADREHPYGHGRIESVASVAIAVLLGVIALEMGRASVGRILEPKPLEAQNWVIVLVVLMMAAKELMARFSLYLGKMINSDTLEADAWHHRSDVFATGLVVIAFIGARYGLNWIDGAAGVGVALLIGWAAWEILKKASGPLIGEHAPPEMYRGIAEAAQSVEGVLSVHDIHVQRYGTRNVISLHAVVTGGITADHAHRIAEEIQEQVSGQFSGHVTVHTDPDAGDHPQMKRVRRIVKEVLPRLPKCGAFHDLRIEGETRSPRISVDLETEAELTEPEKRLCENTLREAVLTELPRAEVRVKFEPPYLHGETGK